MMTKCLAMVRASRLDAALAVGAPTHPGTALAARATQLTSRRHREALARTLCDAVRDSGDRTGLIALRSPIHRANVDAARTAIGDVVARLRAPAPVSARGVARLHRILADGTGPLYRYGRGDLVGRLGAVSAAL
ncbi:hypothetical protein [Mycobacterium sp. GA-2829]|uniref:hypothetical protein n=1 Tax=Mycobacterium sp. GA-2829 TaxID=1772283 RepID=UPI0007403A3A|nr:hypothetical protein [Mycobacterium sp. GA-2829]KUI35004.1 hypothetical protein AU194_26020 [Mycobacterium sp. GA-2829]